MKICSSRIARSVCATLLGLTLCASARAVTVATAKGALPRELTDKVWNTIAAKFQTFEGELERAGNVQLYAECEQAIKQATALIVAATGDATQGPPLRKKEF